MGEPPNCQEGMSLNLSPRDLRIQYRDAASKDYYLYKKFLL